MQRPLALVREFVNAKNILARELSCSVAPVRRALRPSAQHAAIATATAAAIAAAEAWLRGPSSTVIDKGNPVAAALPHHAEKAVVDQRSSSALRIRSELVDEKSAHRVSSFLATRDTTPPRCRLIDSDDLEARSKL